MISARAISLSPGVLSPAQRRGFALLLQRAAVALDPAAPTRVAYRDGKIADGVAFTFIANEPPADLAALLRDPAAVLARSAPHFPFDLPLLFHELLAHPSPFELNAPLDQHGRPSPQGSFLHRHGLLDRPALDLLARAFGDLISPAPPPRPRFALTLDIDSAGTTPGDFRQLLRQAPARLPRAAWEAALALPGGRHDPRVRVQEIAESLEGLSIPATFFTQTHRADAPDNYSLTRRSRLVRQLNAILQNGLHAVGLHSSYRTADRRPEFFDAQRRRLLAAVPRALPVHRSHYLRTGSMDWGNLPVIDSSLGFGILPGFRCGTSFAFEATPHVLELPPTVMDSTHVYHLRQTAEQTLEAWRAPLREVAAVGGTFVPIFHPHHFDGIAHRGWREMLFDLLDDARRLGYEFVLLHQAAQQDQQNVDELLPRIPEAPR